MGETLSTKDNNYDEAAVVDAGLLADLPRGELLRLYENERHARSAKPRIR